MHGMGSAGEDCPFQFNFDEKTFKPGDMVSYRVTGSLEGFPFVGTLAEVHADHVIILRLGMDIPGWPPENIEEMAKKLEQELLG